MLPLGKKTLPERDFCTKFITPEREKETSLISTVCEGS